MYKLHSTVEPLVRSVESMDLAFSLGDNDPNVYKITTEENGTRIVFWKSVNVCMCSGEVTKTIKGWSKTSRKLTNPAQGVLNV